MTSKSRPMLSTMSSMRRRVFIRMPRLVARRQSMPVTRAAIGRADEELNANRYRTHEFGDSVFIARTRQAAGAALCLPYVTRNLCCSEARPHRWHIGRAAPAAVRGSAIPHVRVAAVQDWKRGVQVGRQDERETRPGFIEGTCTLKLARDPGFHAIAIYKRAGRVTRARHHVGKLQAFDIGVKPQVGYEQVEPAGR